MLVTPVKTKIFVLMMEVFRGFVPLYIVMWDIA